MVFCLACQRKLVYGKVTPWLVEQALMKMSFIVILFHERVSSVYELD